MIVGMRGQGELTDEEKAEREENALELALETEAEVNAYELARPKPRGIFMPYIHIGDVAHRWVNGNTFGIIINLCVLGITVGGAIATYDDMRGDETLVVIDTALGVIFMLEVCLKIVAETTRPWMYFCEFTA